MARLRTLCLILLVLVMSLLPAAGEEQAPYLVDWVRMELTVTGRARVDAGASGNPAEWQLEAALRADEDLMSHFIESMEVLTIDGFRTAADVLRADREKNGALYAYYERIEEKRVQYGDDSVHVSKSFPLFGPGGFLHLLVEAGVDNGHFPEYTGYVFSQPFTGLVVDARLQGKEPAAMPRMYDESHELVYSAELMNADDYARWGSVQYVRDPSPGQWRQRVGPRPLRIVAAPDDKLTKTDISLYDEDARRLLQHEETRRSLRQGRVVIIID